MTLKLRARRYGAPITLDAETIDEAVGIAYWCIEDNTASPEDIVDSAGNVVCDALALEAKISSYREARGE